MPTGVTRGPTRRRAAETQASLFLVPMLATPSMLPRNPREYGFEFKWEGIRALAHVAETRVRLQSRSLRDITQEYPEVQGLGEEVGSNAILDGELVALNEEGRPDFGRLQQRMGLTSPAEVRRRMRDVPVAFFAFDLLRLDGRWLLEAPYTQRRRRLEAMEISGAHWQTPSYVAGEGEAVLEASRRARLEGVVAKRLESPYRPGQRTPDWLKIKNRLRQEFVVGGWTRGEGMRADAVGSLLLGFYDDGRLVYAGRVGTGFDRRSLEETERRLAPLAIDANPFDTPVPGPALRFVEPRLVAEVEFAEWTHGDRLRQASFKGFRDDKDPGEVVREDPVGAEHG